MSASPRETNKAPEDQKDVCRPGDAETPLMFCARCGFALADARPEQRCARCGHRRCPSCADS